MSDAHTSPSFIRVRDTFINLSQIIEIVILPGTPDKVGEVHIRTTSHDEELIVFVGKDAKRLRATFNSIGFDIDHVYPMKHVEETGA